MTYNVLTGTLNPTHSLTLDLGPMYATDRLTSEYETSETDIRQTSDAHHRLMIIKSQLIIRHHRGRRQSSQSSSSATVYDAGKICELHPRKFIGELVAPGACVRLVTIPATVKSTFNGFGFSSFSDCFKWFKNHKLIALLTTPTFILQPCNRRSLIHAHREFS